MIYNVLALGKKIYNWPMTKDNKYDIKTFKSGNFNKII